MAEALQLPSLSVSNKYFCYVCNCDVFLFQSAEILCPECRSDFIEEVPDDHDDPDDYEDDSDVDESELNLLNLLSVENLFRRVMGDDSVSPRHVSGESTDEGDGVEPGPVPEIYSARSILQQLEESIIRGHGERLRHVGDYLFGEDMDALSTMLLNETEVVGPPPLPKEQIKLLPLITVSKDDVDKEVQCTICMEDFALREKAKSLPCCHFYHEKCITPWLERHATCPNCRKPVEIRSKNQRSQSCPRSEYSLRNADQRRSSESSSFTGFLTSSVNPFRFL